MDVVGGAGLACEKPLPLHPYADYTIRTRPRPHLLGRISPPSQPPPRRDFPMSDSHEPSVPPDPIAPADSASAEVAGSSPASATMAPQDATASTPSDDLAAQAAKGPRVLIGTQRPGAAPV